MMQFTRKSLSRVRVYADTSVYGGVFDTEFAFASSKFFEEVRAGRFQLVLSATVGEEIAGAPALVRQFFETVRKGVEEVPVSRDAVELEEAYIAAGIVGARWQTDALHVALASVPRCQLIVSWNFNHIVHFDKIGLYNAVNALHSYGAIAIHSPPEVINEDEEDI